METLSIVVPCFNEELTIPLFYKTCQDVLKDMDIDVEYIFIDDGSKDGTLDHLRKLADGDARVHFVSFSRNFGKEAALFAGLEQSVGDYVVTMDVDLQDPPNLLPKMLDVLRHEDFDSVATRRLSRIGEPVVRSFFARQFYKWINRISKTEIVDGARDFRMMKRMMVDAILKDQEYNRFSKGIYSWVGFKTKWMAYENVERSAGKSKWSFMKLLVYAIDGFLAYSTLPLALVSVIGCFLFVVSLLAMLFIIVRALLFQDPVAGWPSLVSIILFLGSVQLLCIGVIGLYISKMYLETKKRPMYIAKERR